jgi:ribonucleoside-diphosphate reductase alpha chain
LIAGTTTGIEPIFATAYKRRYLKNGIDWHYQYVVDSTAKEIIELHDLDPDKIETAVDLAQDYERRMAVQADVQDYVDQGISSTINLPAWDTEYNNDSMVKDFARTLSRYAPRLRGLTCYPDGSRGGQPLTAVPYAEAIDWHGTEFIESDSCKGGVCGI